MSIYEIVDATIPELERVFWEHASIVAEQAGVQLPDAVYHLRRRWTDSLRSLRSHEAVDFRDDGRAAAWRVRLTIWTGPDYSSLIADTDDGRALDSDGSTILYGLPAVAAWVRELCAQAHPGRTLEGLSEATLATKLKSLRVALSNQGGASIWRLRYSVTNDAPAAPAEPGHNLLKSARAAAPRLEHYMAHVRVTREESPRYRQ